MDDPKYDYNTKLIEIDFTYRQIIAGEMTMKMLTQKNKEEMEKYQSCIHQHLLNNSTPRGGERKPITLSGKKLLENFNSDLIAKITQEENKIIC